jgi:cytochrome c peroxidase
MTRGTIPAGAAASTRFLRSCVIVSAVGAAIGIAANAPANGNGPNLFGYADATGIVRTYNVNGAINSSNPFFQPLGTNDRSCGSCHTPSDGWTITPSHVVARFEASDGLDPIFRTNDGSNSPLADVSTVDARRSAYNMLLTKGLIRVGIGVPDDADFELVEVDDPYNYASSRELSLFRRPLPSANLPFLATVMWDGRETFAGQSIHFDLSDQANGATLGHAAAINPLTQDQRDAIVSFETALFTAQATDNAAGVLNAQGGLGGPVALSQQPFYIGINDALGPGFNPRAFTLFDAWRDLSSIDPYTAARAAVARGQEIFNSRRILISDVPGVNDVLGQNPLVGTCTTCHDAPNVGNHSVSLPLDLGLTSEALRTPDMPLYTFRNKTTGALVKTTDPGRALITGKWQQMSLFKGPILRGLAARAPYFHNGIAATLADVVDFYNGRFNLGLTAGEKADLVAFLRAL